MLNKQLQQQFKNTQQKETLFSKSMIKTKNHSNKLNLV